MTRGRDRRPPPEPTEGVEAVGPPPAHAAGLGEGALVEQQLASLVGVALSADALDHLIAEVSDEPWPAPVTAALRVVARNPGHVTLSVWVGRTPGNRGRAGKLTLRTDEWDDLGYREGDVLIVEFQLLDDQPPLHPVGVCRVCGCTDLRACPGGCAWVAHDLCSACAS